MHRGARPPSRDHRLRCGTTGKSAAVYLVVRDFVLALRACGEEPDVLALDNAAGEALATLRRLVPYGALR
jgi:hypothetical protein